MQLELNIINQDILALNADSNPNECDYSLNTKNMHNKMPGMTQILNPPPQFRKCAIPQDICVARFGLSLILLMPESIYHYPFFSAQVSVACMGGWG